MKTESGKSSALKDSNKSFDLDRETVRDILERINGLSYDGQREIIAYLKRRWSEVGNQRSEAVVGKKSEVLESGTGF